MDTSKPNIARVYDYWLGGKDNYAADRDVADRMLEHDPGLRDRVRDNREFVAGVARLAAERGIAQFIDLGAGLPTRPSVHEAARAVHPGARVAYLDNDPVMVSHARALLATGAGLASARRTCGTPLARLYALHTTAPFQNHGTGQLAAFLAGLDLIPPGIAEVRRWLSGIAGTPKCRPAYLVCGVGAKP